MLRVNLVMKPRRFCTSRLHMNRNMSMWKKSPWFQDEAISISWRRHTCHRSRWRLKQSSVRERIPTAELARKRREKSQYRNEGTRRTNYVCQTCETGMFGECLPVSLPSSKHWKNIIRNKKENCKSSSADEVSSFCKLMAETLRWVDHVSW